MKNYLVLHNIRSVINVGAIFRTSDACGIDKIFLTGFTPSPYDRFYRYRKDFKKASLGAEKFLKWEKIDNLENLLDVLKKENFFIIAVEQSIKSIDYKKIKTTAKNVFIFGSETKGLEKNILEKVDEIAEIKQKGKKESLNVSTAVGISLFRILDI